MWMERYWQADFPAPEFREEMSELDFAALLNYIFKNMSFLSGSDTYTKRPLS